jgi:Ribonuclease P 40kDa (Rpp40) subunit
MSSPCEMVCLPQNPCGRAYYHYVDATRLNVQLLGILILISTLIGRLRLELDKEAYERAGLQGQPCRGGGRKHVKARYGMSFLSVVLAGCVTKAV